jgi:hypothetical protein
MRNTLGGQLTLMARVFAPLQKQIGAAFGQAFTSALPALEALAGAIGKNMDLVRSLRRYVGNALSRTAAAVASILNGWQGLNTDAKKTILSVAEFAAGGLLLSTSWSKALTVLGLVRSALSAMLKPMSLFLSWKGILAGIGIGALFQGRRRHARARRRRAEDLFRRPRVAC